MFAIYGGCILFFVAFSIGEFELASNCGNLTCNTNFNTTNLTEILHEDTPLQPNLWLFANAALGIILIFLLAFMYTAKLRCKKDSIIRRTISFLLILVIFARIVLAVYALISYTFSKIVCGEIESEQIHKIGFNIILYLMYAYAFAEIIIVFCITSLEPDIKKGKEEPLLEMKNEDDFL